MEFSKHVLSLDMINIYKVVFFATIGIPVCTCVGFMPNSSTPFRLFQFCPFQFCLLSFCLLSLCLLNVVTSYSSKSYPTQC